MTFKESEQKGREKFRKVLENNKAYTITYQFSEDEYNHIDCFLSGRSISAVEIKDRDTIHSTTYPDSLIEHTKLIALKRAYQISGYTPYYCVFYQDCFYLWDLNKIDLMQVKRDTLKCPKTTCGDNTYIDKVVYHLPFELGKKYILPF